MQATPVIAVYPADRFPPYQPLLSALGELYSVRFEPRAEGPWAGCVGVLLLGVTRAVATCVARAGMRCMAVIGGPLVPITVPTARVRTAPTPLLASPLRDGRFADSTIERLRPIELEIGDEVVSSKGPDPLWIHTRAARAGLDLLAAELPILGGTGYLYEVFQRNDFARLLPLMHFLRELSPWKPPPLRACFMFDDPNLHWRSYGCIDFEKLARHAVEHHYHAAFATVPLDGWYVHAKTAELFRRAPDSLSLLVHGNNHTRAELAQTYPDGERQAIAAQALRRIVALERRCGLEIPRIMAAPHGGCSVDMASALLQVGFEAATISRWSLMHYNRRTWHCTIGLNLAEFLGDGLPIIPRFKLAEERVPDVYLNAFLGKPLILVGHHGDLHEGLGILGRFANRINSLGEVRWVHMREIAESNYMTRVEGQALHVRMYSRRIRIRVPHGVERVLVHRPWLPSEESESVRWCIVGLGKPSTLALGGAPLLAPPGAELEIGSVHAGSLDACDVRTPKGNRWAPARRLLCEARDRWEGIVAYAPPKPYPSSLEVIP